MPVALTVAVLKIIDYLYGAYVSSRLQTQLNNLRADEFHTNISKNKETILFSLSSLSQTLGSKKD